MTGVDTGLRQLKNAARSAEWVEKDATFASARNAWPLPDVPIVQITGAQDYRLHINRRRKVEYFSAWLNQHIPNATHILAEKSRHGIYGTEPELVVDTIRTVVDRARRRSRHIRNADTAIKE